VPLRERGAVGLNRLLGETHTGDEMGSVALAIAGVGAVLGAAITVLVRRERRRMPLGADTHRIEAAATRGFRDARRQAHAYHHFADSTGVSALRDRDSRSH
jgi:LPXTG-motif cell wall-anchored protein